MKNIITISNTTLLTLVSVLIVAPSMVFAQYGTYDDYGYGSYDDYGYGSYDDYGYGSYDDYGYGSYDDYNYGTYDDYDYGTYDDYGYGTYDDYGYGSYDDYGYYDEPYYDYDDYDYEPEYYYYEEPTYYDYDYVDTYDYGYGGSYEYVDTYNYSYDYEEVIVEDYYYEYVYEEYVYEYEEDSHTPVSCDSFKVSDDEAEMGDRVTLTWQTTGGNSVRISPNIGTVSNDGSTSVRINYDTTFILTVANRYDTDTCSVRVEIEEEDDDVALRCDLDASDTRVDEGDRVTLRWEAEGAEEVRLTDDRGNELLERDGLNEDKDYDGSVRVYPKRDTEYTLTVENGNRDRDCEVKVRVDEEDDKDDDDDEVVVYTYHPPVSGIYLGNAPYTGFDGTSAMTYGLYGLVLLWALYGAYYFTIRRKQVVEPTFKI